MRITYNAPVIISFALLCTGILLFDMYTPGALNMSLAVGNQVNWSDPMSVANLFTHVVAHSDMNHLLGNMTFILLLGPLVEEKYGSLNTLLMIILTALITGLLNVSFFSTGLLGASGIVFMLILLASFANAKEGEIPLTFILVAILFLGKEVWMALSDDRISQFAHIIGGICGAFFGFSGIFRKKA